MMLLIVNTIMISYFYDVIENKPMTFNSNLRGFLLKLNRLTGIRIHTHRFRKTFGTMMYTQTRDWRFAQKALRHSDIRNHPNLC